MANQKACQPMWRSPVLTALKLHSKYDCFEIRGEIQLDSSDQNEFLFEAWDG